MHNKQRLIFGYIALIPAIIVFCVFIVYPVINTFYLSFCNYRTQTIRQGPQWIGFANCAQMFSDDKMWTALKFTVLFTLISVVLESVLGMLCALIMNRQGKTRALVCAMILCFGIAFFVTPKKEFSESENRTLAKAPEFTFENVKSGRFMDGIGTYAADHFPMRDRFLSIMTETERLSGRKEINGVYLAQDGSLIEVYDAPVNTQKQIAQFTKLAENVENADCYLMLVPTAVKIIFIII